MKKLLTVLVALALLSSCSIEPESVSKTTNPDAKVSLLFDNDGCKIYRFEDGGHYVYYSDCRGQVEYNYEDGGRSRTRHRVETLNN